MSKGSDVADFEKYNLKDMWGKIKDDPWRLLIGAVDPISTKLWSSITGKEMEPLVDQMGGAYGGHTFSAFGNTDGGVYKRAEEAGIDTKAGGRVHDLAHVISAFYGGKGLFGLMPQQGGQMGGQTNFNWQDVAGQVGEGMQKQGEEQNKQQFAPSPVAAVPTQAPPVNNTQATLALYRQMLGGFPATSGLNFGDTYGSYV